MKKSTSILHMAGAMTAALVLVIGVAPMKAQTAHKVSIGEATGYGLTYSLPQTLVAVTVEAECASVVAGEYAQYAERYLGVKGAAQSDVDTWNITSVTLTPVVEADTSRSYQLKFDKGTNPTCYLTPQGTLWSINTAPLEAIERPAESDEVISAPSNLQVTNAELLKAGSKSKQAEIAANQVFRIRESRLDILTGEADNLPADGAAYKLVLENLEAQEQAYLALFNGRRTVRRVRHVYYCTPMGDVAGEVLFRFSKYYGFVGADDLSGEPVSISVQVTANPRAAQEQLAAQAKKPAASKNQGLAFVKPGTAKVQVAWQGNTLASGELQMGQMGSVEQLPATLFTDKKNPAKATFNPLSGAINLYEQQQ